MQQWSQADTCSANQISDTRAGRGGSWRSCQEKLTSSLASVGVNSILQVQTWTAPVQQLQLGPTHVDAVVNKVSANRFAMATLERTLGLIKPDAVRAGKSREIMQLAELSGFQLLARKNLQVSSVLQQFRGIKCCQSSRASS